MFVQIFMIVQLEPEEYTVCPAPLPQEAGHALQEQCISSTSRLLAANLYLKKNKKINFKEGGICIVSGFLCISEAFYQLGAVHCRNMLTGQSSCSTCCEYTIIQNQIMKFRIKFHEDFKVVPDY